MTGTKMWAKVTVLDFEGKLTFYSRWDKWL